MKASRSSASAPWALEGLGTWGLMPTFLRYSQPRWTCTFSKPSSARSNAPPSARSTSPRPEGPPPEEPPEARLALLVEQRPLLGAGIGVAAVAKPLDPFRLVTPRDLPGPLLAIAHHPGHLPDRIAQRHPPDHQQVGTQHRIGSPYGKDPPTARTPIPPNFVSRSCSEVYIRIRYKLAIPALRSAGHRGSRSLLARKPCILSRLESSPLGG